MTPDEKQKHADLNQQIAALERQRPKPYPDGDGDDGCRRASAQPSYFLHRGSLDAKGSLMTPGVLSVATAGEPTFPAPPPDAKSSWRRRGIRRMAGLAGESADRARDGEPHLAASFRRRHRAHAEQFRQDGRAPVASGTARLAGSRVRRARLEHQGDAPADDEFAGVPDGERRHRRQPGDRSENRLFWRMPRAAAGGGDHPRPDLAVAGTLDRTVGGPGHLSRTSTRPVPVELQAHLARQAGRRSVHVAAQPVRLLEAQHPLSDVRDVRPAEPGQLRAIAAIARPSRRRR